MIITIDGPVCSGKSTVAQRLAHRLGFYYINTGLLFRTVAYVLLEVGYNIDQLAYVDEQTLVAHVDVAAIRYVYTGGQPTVWYAQKDITALLKNPDMDRAASVVSTNASVRDLVLRLEHLLAREYDVILDGRDTGTVVFPQAELKFFLTASIEVRARRWIKVTAHNGQTFTQDQALREIAQRDERDTNRLIAPLRVPPDAIIIDSSLKSIDEVIGEMIKAYSSCSAKNSA